MEEKTATTLTSEMLIEKLQAQDKGSRLALGTRADLPDEIYLMAVNLNEDGEVASAQALWAFVKDAGPSIRVPEL